ncbi:MAG: hypothetical protein IKF05_02380, partial [Erysipelotrichaceae bacterium]|nr:hypothetical protein [Erysipelotrichaceae bacterium]
MSVKKQRNYLLDLLKVLFCVSAIFPGHFAETVGIEVFGVNPFDATMLPGIMAGGYPFTIGTRVLGFRVLSIAIFTFLSGYWMVDHFKRNQKLGVLNKGKDREILGKYFFNVYSSYWPMAFVGTLYALLFAYITIPNLHILSHNFLNTLILTLPRLLGIKGYGLFPSVIVPMDIASSVNPNNLATLTENFTNQNAWYLFSWNQPLWYMFALIAALPMIYLVFVKSESFGLYILTPMLFLFGNIRLETYANVFALLDQGIDMDILRFVSPMALGIWGWYITDWIKRTEFSAT